MKNHSKTRGQSGKTSFRTPSRFIAQQQFVKWQKQELNSCMYKGLDGNRNQRYTRTITPQTMGDRRKTPS